MCLSRGVSVEVPVQANMEAGMGADERLVLEQSLRRACGILGTARTVEAVQAAFRCGWPGFAADFTQAFAFALDSKVPPSPHRLWRCQHSEPAPRHVCE